MKSVKDMTTVIPESIIYNNIEKPKDQVICTM